MMIYYFALLVSRALFKRNRKLENFGGSRGNSSTGGGFKRGIQAQASRRSPQSLQEWPLCNWGTQALIITSYEVTPIPILFQFKEA
jgi:hypothetical protein